jgi:cobalamin biosynthesis protein CobD/CbiB
MGTAVTVFCYLAVLAILGAFMYRSIELMDAASHPSMIPYLVLLLCALSVLTGPLRARRAP